ncbi:MAG: MiaB/RimO family radical SAM methylthiotransferase [Deltaproteobacteria bacterium]|nr:MiaB/RimO family radical SAM methylthiotransferase [Deltaproteobacteria bacterium]
MKYLIETFGCRTNQADSDAIASKLLSKGHSPACKEETADICVINTCTVTAKADTQCRNMIRKLRRDYPKAKIVVTGCFAAVAENQSKKIAGMENDENLVFERSRETNFSFFTAPVTRARPNLKIQDGCDRFCAYCIVPYARGRSRSMPVKDVLEQLDLMHKAGIAEIVLTGIHLGGYGLDLKPETTLLGLLKKITPSPSPLPRGEKVDTDHCFRIRLSSIDPDEWSDELIDFAAQNKMIARHFHIPLQSGDDEILQKMGRRYTTERYFRLLSDIKSKAPDCAIGADVIVGFPGETREHFERTRQFIEKTPIDYLHVFPYSRRSQTASAKLEDTVSKAEKHRRASVLRAISAKKRAEFYKKMAGKKIDVVIEVNRDKKTGRLKGISGNYIPVLLDGDDGLLGRMVNVTLAEENICI